METKLASPIADQPIAFVAGKIFEQPSSPGMLLGLLPIHVDADYGDRVPNLSLRPHHPHQTESKGVRCCVRLRASLSLRTDS